MLKTERALKSVGWLGGAGYRMVINEAERRRRMTTDTTTTLPTEEELGKLVRDASPGPLKGERMVWVPDKAHSQVKGNYQLFDASGSLIAEIRRGGMGAKLTQQEAAANADLFFYAPALARAYLAQAEALSDARAALEGASGIMAGIGNDWWPRGSWLEVQAEVGAARKALALLRDPDAGLTVRPEVEERLRRPAGELLNVDEMREKQGAQDA